ncbi:hypothetical protein KR044_002223, partial [Drosophila immigrans]
QLHSFNLIIIVLGLSEPINQVALFNDLQNNFPLQIGSKLYRIGEDDASWYEAGHICRMLGGNLLNIESSLEMDALLAVLTDNYYWMSGSCLAGNREFLSITSGAALPYVRWGEGEPNNFNGEENCLQLKFAEFNDSNCKSKHKFVCEAK